MKRLLASLWVVTALALLPPQAASADMLDLSAGVFPDDQLAALSSSGDSFAVGGGTTANGTHFAFSAHLGPNGPSGYAVVRDPTLGEAQGPVVCYRPTTSNQAVFYIETTRGSDFFGSRPFLGTLAADFNPPFAADAFFAFPNFAAGSCTFDGGPGGPVTQGNIVVKNR